MGEDGPPRLERLIAALRRPEPVDPRLKERVLAGARAHGTPRRLWLRLPPLALIGAPIAAVLVAVALRGHAESPVPADAPRLVPFVLTVPNAARVSIVGDFNDWDATATPLQRAGGSAWWVVVKLPPGRYHYSFVIDGSRWMADPGAPRAADDDFGPRSSVITILARPV